jgi:hypothetical protein
MFVGLRVLRWPNFAKRAMVERKKWEAWECKRRFGNARLVGRLARREVSYMYRSGGGEVGQLVRDLRGLLVAHFS